MLARDRKDWTHLAHTTAHVDHENCLGPRRDSALDLFRVDVEGVATAVHEHWFSASVHDYVDGREPCHRRSDHFIAGPNSQTGKREVNCGGPTANGQRVGRSLVARKFLLEALDTRPQANPVAADTFCNGGNLFLAEYRSAEDQAVRSRAYWRSTRNSR